MSEQEPAVTRDEILLCLQILNQPYQEGELADLAFAIIATWLKAMAKRVGAEVKETAGSHE